jgi:membrane-associated protease RseP (regulator of RpoE activity)
MIILFLLSLIIIIIVHEAAHLIIAKKCKCGVIRYSIGFGKPILFSKKIGDTIYQITPWIFGGYCELQGELESTNNTDDFINLPYRKKLAIAIAGCAVNVISGTIIMVFGMVFNIYYLIYFGYVSLVLGLSNWIIPIPCLDGGYALWYPILTKVFGKEKGTKIFAKVVQISFAIVIVLNIACIPLLIQLFKTGRF